MLCANSVMSCISCLFFPSNMEAYQVPALISIPGYLWHFPTLLGCPSLLQRRQAFSLAAVSIHCLGVSSDTHLSGGIQPLAELGFPPLPSKLAKLTPVLHL